MYIPLWLVVIGGICACIGALFILLFIWYVIGCILDLTYFERHKIEDNQCPYYIEGENNDEYIPKDFR